MSERITWTFLVVFWILVLLDQVRRDARERESHATELRKLRGDIRLTREQRVYWDSFQREHRRQ